MVPVYLIGLVVLGIAYICGEETRYYSNEPSYHWFPVLAIVLWPISMIVVALCIILYFVKVMCSTSGYLNWLTKYIPV